MPECCNVKDYLICSTFRQLHLLSITKINKTKRFLEKDNICCAHKLFFLLEDNYDYYLQLWNVSNVDSTRIKLTNEILCRIPTCFLRVFPGKVVHDGGFENLNSDVNFRIQLIITSHNIDQFYFLSQKLVKFDYSNIFETYLNRYKFDIEEDISSTTSNINTVSRSNNDIVQSNSSKSLLCLENKHFYQHW